MEKFLKEPPKEPLLNFLHNTILLIINALAILMIVVIFFSFLDLILILYNELYKNLSFEGFDFDTIFKILGGFLGVLIAVEIYNIIVIYLHEDAIQAKVVLSTALIAIGRKVIIFDYKTTPLDYLYAIAALVIAISAAYWVVAKNIEQPKDTPWTLIKHFLITLFNPVDETLSLLVKEQK